MQRARRPSSLAEPSSFPAHIPASKKAPGHPGSGAPRAQLPSSKERSTTPDSEFLSPSRWTPARGSRAPHKRSISACPRSPPVCVCSPVSGNVLRPLKRRESE